MSTIYLDTDEIQTSQEAYSYLKDKKLQKGDEIRILTGENQLALIAVVLLVILAIVALCDKEFAKKQSFGSKIMDELFGNKSPEELEKEIEDQYGISIEVEQKDKGREEWTQFAAKGLADTYDEDEPDYSDVELKEKNPNYEGPAQT